MRFRIGGIRFIWWCQLTHPINSMWYRIFTFMPDDDISPFSFLFYIFIESILNPKPEIKIQWRKHGEGSKNNYSVVMGRNDLTLKNQLNFFWIGMMEFLIFFLYRRRFCWSDSAINFLSSSFLLIWLWDFWHKIYRYLKSKEKRRVALGNRNFIIK